MGRNNNTPTLDLHGIKHKDIFNKIDKFIGGHLLGGITNKVFIITGHSKEMKILVGRVLDNYELYSQESVLNNGMLAIELT